MLLQRSLLDRRVRADGERQQDYRDQKKARIFQEHPDGETNSWIISASLMNQTYSLVPERHHWIDFGRAPRGNETSHQRDDSEQYR